jgi:hypothetical protein
MRIGRKLDLSRVRNQVERVLKVRREEIRENLNVLSIDPRTVRNIQIVYVNPVRSGLWHSGILVGRSEREQTRRNTLANPL